MERFMKIKMTKPKFQAGATQKWQDLYRRRKEELEMKQRAILEKNQEEEERILKQQKVFIFY